MDANEFAGETRGYSVYSKGTGYGRGDGLSFDFNECTGCGEGYGSGYGWGDGSGGGDGFGGGSGYGNEYGSGYGYGVGSAVFILGVVDYGHR